MLTDASGDSFSRSGFRYNRTGIEPQPGPTAENPIGNPKWPGITSSGGMNWIMYMVSEFNYTLSLAYIFARSGSVVDSEMITPHPSDAPSFVDQIGHFKGSMGDSPDYAAWDGENAVAAIWFGVNDVRVTFTEPNIIDLLEKVVKRLFELTNDLYNLGFRKFIIIEVPPINLVPRLQKHRLGDDYEKLLYSIERWNGFLRENFVAFKESHKDCKSVLLEISDIFWDAYLDPQSVGAPNSNCTDKKGVNCVWYDPLHPGKRVHELLAERAAEAAWS
ncbi:hypothetical protein FDECE_2204 [Fusarium decemcellulare]|nr:hypothetical protein FDECE_2204 [Fusarium decemcellulare]